MKILKTSIVFLALLLFGTALPNPARAQTLGKTKVTTTRPMEIPGGKILPAGSYVFKVMDIPGNRNIVQITTKDETESLAIAIAIPDYRLHAGEKPVVLYNEEAAGKPIALRGWYFAGEKNGLEFAYPKKRAVELATATHEFVPAEAAEVPAATAENLESVPLVAITPQGKEEPLNQAFEATPSEPVAQVAQALPKTASPVPLIGLAGGMMLAIGFGLRRFAKQNS